MGREEVDEGEREGNQLEKGEEVVGNWIEEEPDLNG